MSVFIVIIAMTGSKKFPRVQKSASLDEVERRTRVLEDITDSEQEEDQSVFLEEVSNPTLASSPYQAEIQEKVCNFMLIYILLFPFYCC